MKKKKKQTKKSQVIEIHIYVHQDQPQFTFTNPPIYYSPTSLTGTPCPICGKVGPHTCVTCNPPVVG